MDQFSMRISYLKGGGGVIDGLLLCGFIYSPKSSGDGVIVISMTGFTTSGK